MLLSNRDALNVAGLFETEAKTEAVEQLGGLKQKMAAWMPHGTRGGKKEKLFGRTFWIKFLEQFQSL